MSQQHFFQKISQFIQSQNYDRAITDLRGFLDDNVGHSLALSLLGTCYLRSGKRDKALAIFNQAVQLHSDDHAAWADRGFALRQMDQYGPAIESFEKAVALRPDFYTGWVQLQQLYFNAADYRKALDANEKCEDLDPLDAQYQRIRTLMQQGNRPQNLSQAEKLARSMLSAHPGHPRAAFILGHLADGVGATEKQIGVLRHALDYHPANVPIRQALVQAYEKIGLYSDALAAVKTLVALKADYFNFYLHARILGHVTDYEGVLKAAEKAASFLEAGSHELGKVDLLRGHALKILGRRDECEQAYKASVRHTPETGAGWWGLADLKTYRFTEDEFKAIEQLASDEKLDPDQRCQAAFALAKAYENKGDAETAMTWYVQANGLRRPITFDPVRHRESHDMLMDYFKASNPDRKESAPTAIQPSGPIPIFIVGMPRAGSTLLEQILASHSQIEGTMELPTLIHLERTIRIEGGERFSKKYPYCLEDFSTSDLARFGQDYLDNTRLYRTDKPYFIDKLPPNFERIGLIQKILPQAIIIDARRHPLDCGYSIFKQHFASGHDYSYTLDHIGFYYRRYLALMDHWDRLGCDQLMTVQHEELLADLEGTVRTVLDHIGVAFEENCLNFHMNKRAVKTASSEQVRRPITTKAIGRWRAVQAFLSPLIDALGEETLARFKDLPFNAGKINTGKIDI